MYHALFEKLETAGFEQWVGELRVQQQRWFTPDHHGDFTRWQKALDELPDIRHCTLECASSAVTLSGQCDQPDVLEQSLKALRPWRKGPYQVADVFIDTEWRSDFKWERVHPHLATLKNRRILDVGCGNGYHCWRMLNDAPELVIGIDPSVLFNLQFQVIKHYCDDPRIHMLPLTIQQMPLNMQYFDTVFSMGILYHRRSPFDHLLQLKGLLKQGGELCLETLVIEGKKGEVLVPESRYARMNNVWFLPSVDELTHWMTRCGFKNVRLVDLNRTRLDEQRSTEWMPFESLAQCLDADDPARTVEGYPAPLRAVMVANR